MGISTEAEIGKILVLVDIVLGILGLVALLFGFSIGMSFMQSLNAHGTLYGLLAFYSVVNVVGLALAGMGFKEATDGDYKKGWTYSIVASFLPPFRVIMFIGAILMLVSPEASKKTAARTTMARAKSVGKKTRKKK